MRTLTYASPISADAYKSQRIPFAGRYPATIILLGLLLISCTSESLQTGEVENASSRQSVSSSSKNRAPIIRSVQILPTSVALDQQISVQADAVDPDADLVTYRHRWRLNGIVVPGETHATLHTKTLKRGDRLSVEVTPYDGNIEGLPVMADAVVANALPNVTQLLFSPAEVRIGDRVQALVTGIDADQDPIEYRFRWWHNNSEVADGDLHELDTTGFAKGDTIVVEVTPSDPMGRGKSKLSNPITILNSPPKITSVPPSNIERNRYVYAVKASDPDGDPVTYALEAWPPGMKIDKATGRIEWPLSGKLSGTHKIRITATDSQEARAFQEFDVTLAMPAGSSRKSFSKRVQFNTRLVSSFPALLE